MAAKSGNLSINSENIFPIIKKWLYSDHDIFIRELISNGCDAITKLKKLEVMGEYQLPDDLKFRVQVTVNSDNKTISFTDNGLGMTMDEVDEYINQIAFSGAQAFLEQYKDKTGDEQIIGHFGLGFYSAFMVADRVTIDTLSYKEGATPVHWESEGGNEFTMDDGSKEGVGTCITLYLNEDSVEFSNEYRVREVLEKYCSFMPTEIYLDKENAEPQYDTIDADDVREDDTVIERFTEEAKTEEKENEDGTKEMVEVTPAKNKAKILRRPAPVNDTAPLWTKHPNDCTEEEYKAFYRKVFNDYKEPLFWIHLNMDYPFNLKGILYFPKIALEYETIEGVIKLYNNQVFIADNIKEVIPEFLMLLKGVIDCPDLPLNVSRSALQNDGFVKKISDYITKKVADKLTGMYKTEKESFEKYWDDINPFIKFGYIKDEKFREKIQDYMIFKDLNGKYLTLPECIEDAKETHENTLYYVTDEKEQSQYIQMFKAQGTNAVILPHNIDSPFIQQIEQANENLHFKRIDSESDTYKEKLSDEEAETLKADEEALTEVFKKALKNDSLQVKAEKLKDENTASMLTVSEESRRMQEMFRMYGMGGDTSMFGAEGQTLILNISHPLVQAVLADKEGEMTPDICEQLYDLALLSHGSLSPERMTAFIRRSNELMMKLTK
ncbi:MAG: molecular chaperone HtpG [Lachnospiraceae bacterium]|nr:molecular chaperone HtpG [Lachnospiraceae bacterium]